MKLIKFYEAKIIVDCDQNHISNFLFSQSHSRNCQTPKCALVLADRSEYEKNFEPILSENFKFAERFLILI